MAFGNERLDLPPSGVVVSVPTVPGDDKWELDYTFVRLGSASWSEQRGMFLFSTQGLVSNGGFPAPEHGLNVSCLSERGFCDYLASMKMRKDLNNKHDVSDSGVGELPRLERRMGAAETNL